MNIPRWFGLPALEDSEMAWGTIAIFNESGVLMGGNRQEKFTDSKKYDMFAKFIDNNILPSIKKTAESNFLKFLSADTNNFMSANKTYTQHYEYEGKVIVLQMRGSWRLSIVCSLVESDSNIPAENYNDIAA